jgi:hypothetical protein
VHCWKTSRCWPRSRNSLSCGRNSPLSGMEIAAAGCCVNEPVMRLPKHIARGT